MPSPPVMFLCAAGLGLAALLYYYFTTREEREQYAYESPGNGRPSRVRRRPRSDNRYEVEECSICQELMISMASLRILSCGHRFHVRCIDKWLEASAYPATCPNCRQEVM